MLKQTEQYHTGKPLIISSNVMIRNLMLAVLHQTSPSSLKVQSFSGNDCYLASSFIAVSTFYVFSWGHRALCMCVFLIKKMQNCHIFNDVLLLIKGNIQSVCLQDSRISRYLIHIRFIFTYEWGLKWIWKYPISCAFFPLTPPFYLHMRTEASLFFSMVISVKSMCLRDSSPL